ncbi:MAG: hypothetical protein F6K18_09550 [Okeania sp. SIO2C2]|uniref:hypothetical protein n=1 Tax=Okeania sp. SIO2C2 TaxID=2607787 RepID=UPI0013B80A1D|nr:hypothetical protein [Okeania sp. SIO2C2]NEP87058.1 hypothetical protein [Okeania sp. SIO2C2]
MFLEIVVELESDKWETIHIIDNEEENVYPIVPSIIRDSESLGSIFNPYLEYFSLRKKSGATIITFFDYISLRQIQEKNEIRFISLTHKYIGQKTMLAIKTVQRWMKQLIDEEWIVHKRIDEHMNIYKLNFDKIKNKIGESITTNTIRVDLPDYYKKNFDF